MQFEFSIGGYTGNSYLLELKDDILRCEVSAMSYEPLPGLTKFISVKDNPDFKTMLDYLSTRNWKDAYEKPALDGTQWELKIVTDTFNIDTGGSNCYPTGFFKFLRLLNKLTVPEAICVS